MAAFLTWFSPNDTLLVDQAAIVRVVSYAEQQVTLEIVAGLNTQSVNLSIGAAWANIYGRLEARYCGIYVNEKCQPPRQAGIQFRDTDMVDVRRHSIAGVPIRGPLRM